MDHTTWALSSRWPLMPRGMRLTCSRYFAVFLFSESLALERTDESRFSAPQPHGGNPAGKAQAVPRASAAHGGRGGLRRACWLLIASEKAASGGSLHPQCCNPAFQTPLCVLWRLFMWVGAARQRLRSPRDVSFVFKNLLPFFL